MKHYNTLNDRVALVTGAARRIGAAIVNQLHEAGFRVVIHYHHSQEEATSLASKLNQQRPNSALTLKMNLIQNKIRPDLIAETLAWAGQLDLLVNNASIFLKTPADVMDELAWESLFNIHVKTPFFLSHQAYPHLAKTKGSIVNITDTHTIKPPLGFAIYCQSKAALAMQTKVLACEFAPLVRVNSVAPGSIIWPEGDNALSDAAKKESLAKIPLQQQGSPKAIAQAVLAMAENSFITGQTLIVDGGRGLK